MSNVALVRSLYEHGMRAAGGRDRRCNDAAPWSVQERNDLAFDEAGCGQDPSACGLFGGLPPEWTVFSAEARAFLDLGEEVAVVGSCFATCKATGRLLRGAFAHLWVVRDGKPNRIAQHIDTHEAEDARAVMA